MRHAQQFPKIDCIFYAKSCLIIVPKVYYFHHFWQNQPVRTFIKRRLTVSSPIYKATLRYGGDEFFIGISPSGHAQAIDVKGDRKAAATPVELLLIAVGGCTAADVISILLKKRQDVTDYQI